MGTKEEISAMGFCMEIRRLEEEQHGTSTFRVYGRGLAWKGVLDGIMALFYSSIRIGMQ